MKYLYPKWKAQQHDNFRTIKNNLMNKTWLIIKREYWTRVKKKTFLITTLFLPILVAGLIALVSYLAAKSEQKQFIIIQDESGFFINKVDSTDEFYTTIYSQPNINESKKDFLERNNADILVRIFPFKNNQPDSVIIYKEGGVSLSAKSFISNELDKIYQVKQMQDAGINMIQIDSINNSTMAIKSYDLENNKETSSEIAMAMGYGMGFLMYIIIFIYGAGVMRGVMEEKTNRIAEVIISSVKPFQLMMGKILGIGLVGLTQFIIWLSLMGFMFLISLIVSPEMNAAMHSPVLQNPEMQEEALKQMNGEFNPMIQTLLHQNWGFIIGAFLFYFLGGYFIYAAMFAAVGSLVNEDPQEAQQLTLPISLPIIFGIIILQATIKDPNSPLAIFGSLFPLTSPIVMLGRIPYGVPTWQIISSMLLLMGGFVLMTWISAKIYRTGILMYGKKPTFKEIIKWVKNS